jgi:hypothetical protein
MALTTEQEREINNRLRQGQKPRQIITEMNIDRADFRQLRRQSRRQTSRIKMSPNVRLARLRSRRDEYLDKVEELNQQIARLERS